MVDVRSLTGADLLNILARTDVLTLVSTVLVVCLGIALFAVAAFFLVRAIRQRTPEQPDAQMLELARLQNETAVRVQALGDMLAGRQADLARAVNERLDAVTHRLGQSMHMTSQHTAEHLSKLNERLAVIDHAQKNITDLASQVTTLQSVLGNKQLRGAFGQSRMEMIIQDGLPKTAYEFQSTLSNRARPDCCVFLPDQRPLVIDAKFPLEAVTALREAQTDEARKAAAAQLRHDITKHVADIAQKYLIPGELRTWR